MKTYLVLCMDCPILGYSLATRTVFPSQSAAEMYVTGIHPSWRPLVVEAVSGDTGGLRHDHEKRFGTR